MLLIILSELCSVIDFYNTLKISTLIFHLLSTYFKKNNKFWTQKGQKKKKVRKIIFLAKHEKYLIMM